MFPSFSFYWWILHDVGRKSLTKDSLEKVIFVCFLMSIHIIDFGESFLKTSNRFTWLRD